MKIAVDENIPHSVVNEFHRRNWDVLDIRGTPDEGMQDDRLWQRVQAEKRLFVTTDKGFAKYRDTSHLGLIIVALRHPNSQKIFNSVFQEVEQFDEWENRMVVMRDTVQSVWISNK